MKKQLTAALLLLGIYSQAQIGIGTTSPNSTLDVRGSLSLALSTFSTNTTAGASDNTFLFTGTSPATLTLPTAVAIAGREYWVKNISSNSSILTIGTTSSQTIDGLSSWLIAQTNKTIRLVSNGVNWLVASESLPGNGSGTGWLLGGNSVLSLQNIGTTSNYDLPFITNNTEKMRLTSGGSLGIGTSTFNGTYTEKFLVDAGSTGNTNYQNVLIGKGNTNSYSQLNIQNAYTGSAAGTIASSDVVATADNGTESINYIDMGINSSGNNSTGVLGGANTAYLYSTGNDFAIGNGSNTRNLNFFTTTGGTYTERMRIDANGNVGIGTSSPTANLHVAKSGSATGNIAQFLTPALGSTNATYLKLGKSLSNGDQADIVFNWTGANSAANYLGFSFFSKPIYMILTNAGNVGIGSTTFNPTYPERLIVDAGSNGSGAFQNVIVGKGNTNSYAQLNIQNNYNGTAVGTIASSDVVATSDNGNESVNFIDMGINSSGNNSTGVLGAANTAYLYATGNNFAIGNGTNARDILFFTTTGGTYTERMRITSAGHLIPSANNAYNLGSAAFRWSTIYSQNVLNVSDARLKANIADLNYGLSSVLKMRPVQYNWKEGIDKDNKIGFLAQELRTVIPEVVVGDESKENLAVNYIELIPVLVNAIKEQQKQIDDLTKKVKMLEKK